MCECEKKETSGRSAGVSYGALSLLCILLQLTVVVGLAHAYTEVAKPLAFSLSSLGILLAAVGFSKDGHKPYPILGLLLNVGMLCLYMYMTLFW